MRWELTLYMRWDHWYVGPERSHPPATNFEKPPILVPVIVQPGDLRSGYDVGLIERHGIASFFRRRIRSRPRRVRKVISSISCSSMRLEEDACLGPKTLSILGQCCITRPPLQRTRRDFLIEYDEHWSLAFLTVPMAEF